MSIYLEELLNRGWTVFCGAGVIYEPQLAKASIPCGVVSTREKSVFIPGLLELMGHGRICRTAVEPYHHRVRRNAPREFAGLFPPRVSLAIRAQQTIDVKPLWVDDWRIIMRGCMEPRVKSVVVPGLSGFF